MAPANYENTEHGAGQHAIGYPTDLTTTATKSDVDVLNCIARERPDLAVTTWPQKKRISIQSLDHTYLLRPEGSDVHTGKCAGRNHQCVLSPGGDGCGYDDPEREHARHVAGHGIGKVLASCRVR